MSGGTVNISNTQVSVAAGAIETVNGDDDVIAVGAGALLAVNGYGDTINGSDDKLAVNDNSLSNNTVNGSFDIIDVPINSHLTVNGTGEKINDDGHGYLTLGGAAGGSDVVLGTVLELTVPADFRVNFIGTQNNFYLGDGCTVFVAGDDDNLMGSDERFILSGSIKGGDEIVGARDRAFLLQATSQPSLYAQLLLYGDDEVIHAGVHTSLIVESGTDDRLIGAGFYVQTTGATNLWIGGNGETGAADTLTGSNFTARLGVNANIVISGDDDIVAVGALTQLDFVGVGLNAHVGLGAEVFITGKGEASALDTLTGAGFSLTVASGANVELAATNADATLGANVNFKAERSDDMITTNSSDTISILSGVSDRVVLASNDVVDDGGAGTTFVVNNQVGATTINGFAADPLGVVDLLSGIGGYATPAAAAAALTSDADGGRLLSLGIYGSIDFAGDASLSAANFKIG